MPKIFLRNMKYDVYYEYFGEMWCYKTQMYPAFLLKGSYDWDTSCLRFLSWNIMTLPVTPRSQEMMLTAPDHILVARTGWDQYCKDTGRQVGKK